VIHFPRELILFLRASPFNKISLLAAHRIPFLCDPTLRLCLDVEDDRTRGVGDFLRRHQVIRMDEIKHWRGSAVIDKRYASPFSGD
jgi:hypothetical protein|tara:strand:+ start:458 stop:715 length:258 start_codon:yes stop_codon:yes gene_type:complete